MASALKFLTTIGQGDVVSGIKQIAALRNITPALETDYLTGAVEDPQAAQARQAGNGFFDKPFVKTVAGIFTGLAPGAGAFKSAATSLQDARSTDSPLRATIKSNLQSLSGGNMGFFDDIFGNNDTIGSGFDAGLGGGQSIDYGALLNTGVSLANRFLGPQQNNNLMMPAQLTTATLPAVIGAGGMVVRGAMTALAARLAAVGLTRASAWSLLKSQGPTALLALGLTAAEVVTVARKGAGRRRMNMCNGRALRRAQRRLTSFHNFYKKTCGMPSVRHRKKSCK